MDPSLIALAVFAYLLGGIPTGYLVAKRVKGIDIRQFGSGNPGAANVYRVVGRGAGWVTLTVDALKGFLPVILARQFYPTEYASLIGVGALAIFGHIWTIYLRFSGGKGVATSCGVFAALLPVPTLACFGVFVVAVALSGHISVGSMIGSAALPVFAWLRGEPTELVVMAAVVAALILVKHVPNIRRLLGRRELAFRGGETKEPVGAPRDRP